MGLGAGLVFGSLFGAGGQVAAAELSKPSNSSGDQIATFNDPLNNRLLVDSARDAGQFIGSAGPRQRTEIERLIGQITALPINNKLKRRALAAISEIRSTGAQAIDDPLFRRRESRPEPFDDVILTDVRFGKELRGVLNRLGLTGSSVIDAINTSLEEEARFKAQDEERQPILDQIAKERFETAANASELLADAGRFATSGESSEFQTGIVDRINRGIDDQEEQLLLRARFGGFQPGAGLEGLGRQRTDAPFTALEQALAAAGGLTAGLGGGLEFAQQSAGQIGNLQLGAAGISAQQALAANQIRANANLAEANARGQGISGAFDAVGRGFSNAALFGSQSPAAATNQSFVDQFVSPDFGNAAQRNAELNRQFGFAP